MNYAFEAVDIYKSFGDVHALDGVTLRAESAKIFGLLGPNGAGKTTLVRMLSTLMVPDKGSLTVKGINVAGNPQKVREIIGLAGQYAAVDEFLTGRENLNMVGRLYHLDKKTTRTRTEELLERLGLSEAANRPVKTYSGGMRRRLDLGASLVGKPEILFLDEPTTGLDPRTRLDLWDLMRDLISEGTTILLTTQYLDEADELADKIAVIDHGKVIVEGTSDQLKSQLGGDVIEFTLTSDKNLDKALGAMKKISKKPTVSDDGITVSVPAQNGAKVLPEIVRTLDEDKIEFSSLSLHRPSLDDVFLAVTGSKPETENSKKSVKP